MNLEELWARAEAGNEDAVLALVAALDKANRPMDSLSVLTRAARRGSALARLTIGVRAVLGQVPQLGPDDAVTLIKDSARQGTAQAAEMLAGLICVGYARGDIADGLDMLLRAAELGSLSARRQLAILTSDRERARAAVTNESGPDLWLRFREAIDVQALLAAPLANWLSESPRIGAIGDFVSAATCDWLIKRSAPRLQRATIFVPNEGGNRLSPGRTNSYALFNFIDFDFLIALALRRIALAVHLPLNQIENFSVLHYAPGEEFSEHHDFLDPGMPNYQEVIETIGERILTFLIYLNDDFTGGETAFPHLGISHKGGRGDALFFFNTGIDGKPDPRTLHAGRPPSLGEKWVASVFIRDMQMTPVASA